MSDVKKAVLAVALILLESMSVSQARRVHRTDTNKLSDKRVLDKYAETQNKTKSCVYTYELTTYSQNQATKAPYKDRSGKCVRKTLYEARFDGKRTSLRRHTRDNVKSAKILIPKEKGPYNSVLNEWIEKNNVPFPVGIVQGDVEKSKFAWGIRSLPWLILTNPQHIVLAEGFGPSELNEKISAITQK